MREKKNISIEADRSEKKEVNYFEVKERRKRTTQRVKTLTRKEIEAKLEEKMAGKKVTQNEVIDMLFDSIQDLMQQADPFIRLEIRAFGVFEIRKGKLKSKDKKEKKGKTGKKKNKDIITGKRKMVFKPGKLLQGFLGENKETETETEAS